MANMNVINYIEFIGLLNYGSIALGLKWSLSAHRCPYYVKHKVRFMLMKVCICSNKW